MSDGDANDPLQELQRRIEGAQRNLGQRTKSGAGAAVPSGAGSALALAWRIGVELVGAVVIAEAIGWAMDRWLGTRPWGMIVMFFLGVAAGMLNVWRAVRFMGPAAGGGPGHQDLAAGDRRDDED